MIAVPKGVSPIELCDEFHFVGFWNEPEKSDYKSIGKNLRLILHLDWPILNLILLRPPQEIFDFYKNNILKNQ